MSLKESPSCPQMPLHEWLAVMALILFLGSLTLFVALAPEKEGEELDHPHFIADQSIEVVVEGAVKHPGVHVLERGMRVEDLLERADPLPEADLSRIKAKRKLRAGQVIKVPKIPLLTIYLKGAVKSPGPLQVRKGTRLQELLELVEFQPGADLSKLRKRRLLKEGERIYVESLPS